MPRPAQLEQQRTLQFQLDSAPRKLQFYFTTLTRFCSYSGNRELDFEEFESLMRLKAGLTAGEVSGGELVHIVVC